MIFQMLCNFNHSKKPEKVSYVLCLVRLVSDFYLFYMLYNRALIFSNFQFMSTLLLFFVTLLVVLEEVVRFVFVIEELDTLRLGR